MVDVDLGVLREAVHHQVDRLLEGPLLRLVRHLALLVHCPEGVERRLAGGPDQAGLEDPEEIVDTIVQRERVTLDVEEEIPRSRRGKAREAAVRLERAVRQPARRQQLVDRPALVLASDLDAGLVAAGLEDASADLHQRLGERQLQPREAPTGGHSPALQCPAHSGRRPGHEREVVVGPPPAGADLAPAADLAVLDRLRICPARRVRGSGEPAICLDPLFEGRLDHAVVGHVVGDAMGFDGSRAATEGDVHPLGRKPLDRGQLLHVRADLQQRGRPDMAGELGVHHLVAPGTETAGPLDTDQEVRQPEPPPVEERGLVDHVVTALDGLTSGPGRRLQSRPSIGPITILRDPSHPPAGLLQPREIAPLVLLAALRDQVYLRIETLRLRDQAGKRSQLQPDEMLAGQEADQIRGGEDGLTIDELHRHHHTARRRQLACHRRRPFPAASGRLPAASDRLRPPLVDSGSLWSTPIGSGRLRSAPGRRASSRAFGRVREVRPLTCSPGIV